MKKLVYFLIALVVSTGVCYGVESSHTPEPDEERLSVLSIYTANVEPAYGENFSVAVIRQEGRKARLYRCAQAFKGLVDSPVGAKSSVRDEQAIVNFFETACKLFNVEQKNYLKNRAGTRLGVVFSSTGTYYDPISGEVASDVTTHSTELYPGLGVSTESTVLLVGSRVIHFEKTVPRMHTYRLTFFHVASTGAKDVGEIQD